MAYEIEFIAQFDVLDPDIYINDCCWGGDVLCDRLLPAVRSRFSDIQSNQEDWGWFIWFRHGALSHAIDIYCDERGKSEFRIHISSHKKKWLIFREDVNSPEIGEIKELVVQEIRRWGEVVKVARCTPDFMKELGAEPV